MSLSKSRYYSFTRLVKGNLLQTANIFSLYLEVLHFLFTRINTFDQAFGRAWGFIKLDKVVH